MNSLTSAFLAVVLVCVAPAVMAGTEAAGMQDMTATMQRIRDTEDPAERERLLEQHLDQMHAKMADMHRSMGEMMGQMEAQQNETKRLHDHRKTKNR